MGAAASGAAPDAAASSPRTPPRKRQRAALLESGQKASSKPLDRHDELHETLRKLEVASAVCVDAEDANRTIQVGYRFPSLSYQAHRASRY